MHGRARFPRPALAIALVLALATAAWLVVAVPALVKYPTDLDVAPRYEGTFTVFVDPATAFPLEQPVELPLTVDRRIEAVPDESGGSTVLVQETITQQAGGMIDATQTNVYVMDRSTLRNVRDDRAYAFDPANTVDRSGAYRLNLPFDTDPDGTYEVYKNEIGGTYRMAPDTATPTTETEGLALRNFAATLPEAPMDPAYFEQLNQIVPLPTVLTFEQLRPHLRAAGIDVDAVLAALSPVISSEDLATLAAATSQPVALDYVVSFDGRASVEPTTGAEVVVGAREAVGARPDLASADDLRAVLARYPEVPEAAAAIESLDSLLAGPPVSLFEYEYEQTAASVADIAAEVRSMRQQVRLARVWVPAALAVGALLALAVGAALALRRARPAPPEPQPQPPVHIDLTEPTAEPEQHTVTAGGGAGRS